MNYVYEIIDDASKSNVAIISRDAPIPHLSAGGSVAVQVKDAGEFVPYTVISVTSLVSSIDVTTQRISITVGPLQIRSV